MTQSLLNSFVTVAQVIGADSFGAAFNNKKGFVFFFLGFLFLFLLPVFDSTPTLFKVLQVLIGHVKAACSQVTIHVYQNLCCSFTVNYAHSCWVPIPLQPEWSYIRVNFNVQRHYIRKFSFRDAVIVCRCFECG